LHGGEGSIDRIAHHLIGSQDKIMTEATTIAHRISQNIPVLYTPSTMLSLGIRSCQQINENAKMLCRNHMYPECNHNEMLGWT
jgi:glucose/mannose-6-phosphate isomerase